MPFDIKGFKPRYGNIKQGFYNPTNKEKYIGDKEVIIYRSSWELKFLMFCDRSARVVRYSSEPIGIPYYNTMDHKIHKYYIDFYVEMQNENDVMKWLIEVKPIKFIQMPKRPKLETLKTLERYTKEVKRYMINHMKFDAAKNYAKENGMTFGIVTENFVMQKMM